MSVVVEGARRELLCCLASYADMHRRETGRSVMKGEDPTLLPTHVPLFVGLWNSATDDVLLAAKEAAKLGDIEFNDAGHPNGAMVRITEQGYAKAALYANLAAPLRSQLHDAGLPE